MGLARNVPAFDWDSSLFLSETLTTENVPQGVVENVQKVEDERDIISKAQEALDRLDFKSADDICTEVSRLPFTDPDRKGLS